MKLPWLAWAATAGVVVLLAAVPLRSTGYLLHVLTIVLVFGLMAEGWRLLGWIDLGAALYFGLGGYAAGLIGARVGLPWPAEMLVAAALGALVAEVEARVFAVTLKSKAPPLAAAEAPSGEWVASRIGGWRPRVVAARSEPGRVFSARAERRLGDAPARERAPSSDDPAGRRRGGDVGDLGAPASSDDTPRWPGRDANAEEAGEPLEGDVGGSQAPASSDVASRWLRPGAGAGEAAEHPERHLSGSEAPASSNDASRWPRRGAGAEEAGEPVEGAVGGSQAPASSDDASRWPRRGAGAEEAGSGREGAVGGAQAPASSDDASRWPRRGAGAEEAGARPERHVGGSQAPASLDDASRWPRRGAGAEEAGERREGDAGGSPAPASLDDVSGWRRGGAGAEEAGERREGGVGGFEASASSDAASRWTKRGAGAEEPGKWRGRKAGGLGALAGWVPEGTEGSPLRRAGAGLWVAPIVSLAVVPAAGEVAVRWSSLTGGAGGQSHPATSPRGEDRLLLLCVNAAVMVAWWRNGTALPGVGGACLAVAGGLYALSAAFVDPGTVFDPGISLEVIAMALLVRAGGPLGPLAGAAILTVLGELLNAYAPGAHLPVLAAIVAVAALVSLRRPWVQRERTTISTSS
jgi:hypothetical protein